MTVFIIGSVIALAAGVWVGLGHPGFKGRDDRIVEPGRAHRLERKPLNWTRPEKRERDRNRRR